jgi:phosphohistidine phosphatase
MALFLAQHGKAAAAEIDPERGLTAEGRAEVERIAGVARGYGVKVSAIFHSGKKRARETAEIFAEKLGPGIRITATTGMDPKDDVTALAGRISAADNQLFVGHLPFMEKMTSYLITGSADTTVIKFQNGGIVCLDTNQETGTWVIRWALMPHIS